MKEYNSNLRYQLKAVEGCKFISKEQYSQLISAYKKYDTNQKRLITKCYVDINSMGKKLAKYEKIVNDIENIKLLDKYSDSEKMEELCSFIREYESKKKKLDKLSLLTQRVRQFERLWIDEIYPQYRETKISKDKLDRIAEILAEK